VSGLQVKVTQYNMDIEAENKKKEEAKGVFKDVFRGDVSQREHWSQSVKGKVSNDYKGWSDEPIDKAIKFVNQYI